ncbi:MAG TPA: C45 family peptidase [Actinomycetota bacterium]|nr:C45 family peptidase [Actinomycetota bacterium]
MRAGSIRVLELRGAPFDRGVEHGRAVGDLIALYWEELVREVTDRAAQTMTEPELRAWVADRASPALALSPDLHEEIRGIAEGSGVGYEAAVGVNLFEEIADLSWARGRVPQVAREHRCSAAIVPPDMTTTGTWLLAQNWDGSDWWDDPVLFVVEEETGTSVYLTDAGSVGGIGVNDRGLASAHTGVGLAEQVPGLPYSIIARRILQAGDVAAAAASVVDEPSTAGCHYIVADGKRVLDVEAAGVKNATIAYDGLFSTCAHFLDGSCASQQLREDLSGSVYRTERIQERVREAGRVGPDDLFGVMADHAPGPRGITVCRHPDANFDTRTSGCVVMGTDSRMWTRTGNPCEARPIVETRIEEGRALVATAA